MITPDEQKMLDELKRLHTAATPGPWLLQRHYVNEREIVPRIVCEPDSDRGCGQIANLVGAPYLGYATTIPNANLIALSRNSISALLAIIERQQAEIERLTKIVEVMDA